MSSFFLSLQPRSTDGGYERGEMRGVAIFRLAQIAGPMVVLTSTSAATVRNQVATIYLIAAVPLETIW